MLSRAAASLLLVLALASSAAGAAKGPPPGPTLLAGAAAVEITLPPGVPLAGYGARARRLLVPDVLGRYPHAFWFKPSLGARDPIMARALVIETPPERVLWIATDLVAVDAALVADVRARAAAAGFGYSAVIVSASHTHSGPGGFVRSRLFGILATDRLDNAVRGAVLDGIAAAVERAERDRRPARAGAASATAPGLTASRLDLPLDPQIALLKFVKPDGTPLALVWNYAIHGTTLGARNLKLSADVMGIASSRLEGRLGAPVLFVNGAVGDVSPRGHGEAAAVEIGERLADVVFRTWSRAPVLRSGPMSTERVRIELPGPHASLRNCAGEWVPDFLRVPIGPALPASAEITAVSLGDSAWVTIPGELQTQLGRRVTDSGRRHFGVPFVAGLSNGYLGYFLTPDAYRRTSYIGCASFYGDRAGEQLATAAARLLERLGRARATRAPRGAARGLTSFAPRCCGGSHPS